MNNVLDSFITLDENLVEHLCVKNSFSAFYINNSTAVPLDLEKTSIENEEYYLSSSDDKYNIANNNLCIRGCVSINNIKSLYGKENDYSKIALDDTVIGVSLNAYSIASKRNITKPIGEIKIDSENNINIYYDINFPTGALADKLFISLNLYVKEVKTKSNIFASIDGTILGTIYTAIINLEGTGSIFPIRVVSSKEEPLWFVDFNYDDLNDAFCQNNICLNINASHFDFEKIGSQDITPDNKAIWKEILSAFFLQLIMGLSDNEKDELYKDDNYDEGSIGLFLQYIVDSLEIDKQFLNDPITLNKKLLLGLDRIMK